MALKKRERTLLWFTITVIVLGINYIAISRIGGTWGDRSRRLRTRQGELSAIQAMIEQRPTWAARSRELRSNLGQRMDRLQGHSDVLKAIEEIGAQSGILIKNRKMLPEVPRAFYRELPVQCAFDATLESLVRFLVTLKGAGGFLNVEQLSVGMQPDNSGILRCDIKVRAWASKSEKPGS